jgi:type IV fimbrial biogenesis protein FimT
MEKDLDKHMRWAKCQIYDTAAAKSRGGFSLLELMIVVAILSIVATLGTPALQDIVRKNQLRTLADTTIAMLNLARSEAVSRNTPVSLCHTSNNTSCTGAWNTSWSGAWLIFTDPDQDGVVDTGETIVRVFEGLPGGYTAQSDITSAGITYRADGSIKTSGELRICAADQNALEAWQIEISTVGRPRADEGTSSCP